MELFAYSHVNAPSLAVTCDTHSLSLFIPDCVARCLTYMDRLMDFGFCGNVLSLCHSLYVVPSGDFLSEDLCPPPEGSPAHLKASNELSFFNFSIALSYV